MSGVYAVEMTFQQNIDTERMENGSKKTTFSSFEFGTSNDALTSTVDSFVDFRLYTNTLNIIRTANTQKDNIRLDVNNVGLQNFNADEEWKLRVVFDTINKTYTVFVDDAVESKAIEFPYNVLLVDGSLNIPTIKGVTWASGNPSIITSDGKLTTKVTQPTPITFTATGTVADTEVANRTFNFTKTYDMTVVSNSWTLSATKSDKTVKASVSSMNENYGLQPVLVIVGYNSNGAMCDMHIKPVTEKMENYEYTVNGSPATTKVFLLDTLSSSIPLAQHIPFN